MPAGGSFVLKLDNISAAAAKLVERLDYVYRIFSPMAWELLLTLFALFAYLAYQSYRNPSDEET